MNILPCSPESGNIHFAGGGQINAPENGAINRVGIWLKNITITGADQGQIDGGLCQAEPKALA